MTTSSIEGHSAGTERYTIVGESCARIQSLYGNTTAGKYPSQSAYDATRKYATDDAMNHLTRTSPHYSSESTGTSPCNSESSMEFDHAGYRLNLLCQQDFVPIDINCDKAPGDDKNKSSCLFAENNYPHRFSLPATSSSPDESENFYCLNYENLDMICL